MKEETTAFVVALLVAVGVLLAAGLYALSVLRGGETAGGETAGEGRAGEAGEGRQQGGRRGRRDENRMQRGLRRRRAAAGAQPDAEEERGADEDGGSGESSEDDGAPLSRKEAKKKAQREARQAREAAREAKESKKNTYEERRAAKDAEREAKESAEREAATKEEEERRKKEDEEAAQWMNLITVDEGGSGEAELAAEDQGLLGRFVDFIKERKTVLLEEVAAEFGLRVTDVINRVEGLEGMGRITGVMDDRGKYIFISPEEMEAVAGYMKSRGRISIAELAQKSNTFIDLESKTATSTNPVAADFNIDTLDEEVVDA